MFLFRCNIRKNKKKHSELRNGEKEKKQEGIRKECLS